MSKVKTAFISFMFMLGLVALPAMSGTIAFAANKDKACEGISSIGGGDACNGGAGDSLPNFIERIINILLFLIGAIAVIMIIIGGIRYVTSNGDQSQLTGAKNTILYAIVGLVIAIMAFAIVNFVVKNI